MFLKNSKIIANQGLPAVYQESRKVLFPKDNKWVAGFFLALHVERQRGNLWIPISHLSLE